jgi:hypothetical protein
MLAAGKSMVSVSPMNDEDFDQLAEGLNKLGRGQVHALVMLAKLQAQVLTLEAMVSAMQLNSGADAEEQKKQKAAAFAVYEKGMLDSLKDWLAKNKIIDLPKDDEWWDKPST